MRSDRVAYHSLPLLTDEIVQCRACPRLVRWRERVAAEKVARFRTWTYWGRPVPGFGDPNARILFVGLAPAAHGANRTGRMFTGDRSGDFLYAAMHRAGLATKPTAETRDDGLELRDAYIVSVIRCAPPQNRPEPAEIARCSRFLHGEIALLPRVRVFVALGGIAWRACLEYLEHPRPRPAFAHGAIVSVGRYVLLGSYHVSQQNTQTGRLTPAMFDSVLAKAKSCAQAQTARPRLPGRGQT